MWYALDENHKPYPTTVQEMGNLPSQNNIVAQEDVQIGNINYLVSTIFLYLDYSYNKSEPILFETMVFTEDAEVDQYQERYTTWDKALAKHEEIVKSLRLGITDLVSTPRPKKNN